ncbi:MAG TPA: HNH endonuclease signature motif containing protein [Caulobacteraceae bacterium]|nr:HNH endonuclease signature motif containing protein [Caulobacteraceae bacterium]
MTDVYLDPTDSGLDPDAPPGGVNTPNLKPSLNRVGLSLAGAGALGQRLGQTMRSIVADPNGLKDLGPDADPWIRQLRAPRPTPFGPGLLDSPGAAPATRSSGQTLGLGLQPAIRPDTPFGGADDPRLDFNLASDGDGQFYDIGGKQVRQRRQWSLWKGIPWPIDPETGRNFDIAHIIAKADGGSDAIHNIQPLHPLEHRRQHMENGDFSRWGRRGWHGNEMGEMRLRGLGLLQIIPDITGILSGRIRTDNWNNFMSDMIGVPSQQDMDEWYQTHPPEA